MKTKTVTINDGGCMRRLRLIAQMHPDGEHAAVRVTYMGEEGGRIPLEDVTVRHHRDRMYLVDPYMGLCAAMERGLEAWKNDLKR